MRWTCWHNAFLVAPAAGAMMAFAPIAATASAPTNAAGAGPGGYPYARPILGDMTPGRIYRLAIPDAVYMGSRRFPYDLQIVDELGERWPLSLWMPPSSSEYQPRSVQVLEQLISPEKANVRRLRVLVQDEKNRHAPRHNRLTLFTAGTHFVRRVEVQGSRDQKQWEHVGAGYLINYPRGVSVSRRTIHYPEIEWPFLDIHVYPDTRQPADRPEVFQVEAGWERETGPEYEDVPMERLDLAPADEGSAIQVILADSGVLHRPIDRLELAVREKFFRKAVRVFGSNAEPPDWRWAADGEIHRMPDHESLTIPLENFSARFVKLEILSYEEDPPLTITGVRAGAVPRFLLVEAGPGRHPQLLYGSDRVTPDVLTRKPRRAMVERPAETTLVRLQEETPPADLRPRFSARRAILAILAAATLLLGALFIVVRRKSGRSGPGGP
jgi:hypothetical protein